MDAMAKFYFITGKGGAGKSLHACALASALAASGRRTLLAELGHRDTDAFSRLHEFFAAPPLKQKPAELQPLLWGARLDPALCLSEYLALKLPGGAFAAVLLNNKVTRTFLDVIPGLTDIVSLGKLWYGLTVAHEYDAIVLDGPASGHALSLARTPANFAKLTKRGPLFKDAEAMQKFFRSKEAKAILVTLPEALSVSETSETREQLQNDFANIDIVLNKRLPAPSGKISQVPPAYAPAIAYYTDRLQKEAKAVKDLHTPFAEFPHFLALTKPEKVCAQAAKIWSENL